MTEQQVCTAVEAAIVLGMSEGGVRHALQDGRLAGVRHGRKWLVLVDDLAEYHDRIAERVRENGRRSAEKRRSGNVVAGPGFCTVCGVELGEDGSCVYCQRQQAGIPYYAARIEPCWSSHVTGTLCLTR